MNLLKVQYGDTSSVTGASEEGAVYGFVAVRQMAPLAVQPGMAFAFELSEDTFKHADTKAQISLDASSHDGQPLPDWLQFNPGERRFVGTAPNNVKQIQVRVVASDERGEQIATTITLSFDN